MHQVVERVRRQEQRLEFFLERLDRDLEDGGLCARLGGHLCVVRRRELARGGELVVQLLQSLCALNDLAESLVLAPQRRHKLRVADRLWIEELPFDGRRAGDRVGE